MTFDLSHHLQLKLTQSAVLKLWGKKVTGLQYGKQSDNYQGVYDFISMLVIDQDGFCDVINNKLMFWAISAGAL